MKKRLLQLIECKSCKEEFQLHTFNTENLEIKDGLLICPKCNVYYFIVNFIPRILPRKLYTNNKFEEKFEKQITKILKNKNLSEKDDSLLKLKKDTTKFFGYEWVHFDRHGFDDEVYNENFEKNIFHHKTLLRSNEIKNKLVLDAGCGNGRYVYQALKCGAEVVGFDLGPGVDSAYNNTKQFAKAHIIQADVFNLPFKDNIFNFAFTIGVIHHTGNAKRALKCILEKVKEKGTIAVTCYHKGNMLWEFNDWLIRKFTLKMSIPNLMTLSKILAKSCKFFGLWVEKPVNLLFRWEPNISIMFDWYSAPIATHHTYPEVYSWCKEFGINVTEDLRWEKREWIRNIRWIREFIAPDFAITIKGIKEKHSLKFIKPKHVWDKTKINW
ncbi:methyltransferase domain-containing protein [Candidatus Woesearchaeota archaeon]|jgi:SAM-dependent methyltransferase/uncharacterized protein YbaR (Trm112 family)|nr:methyltransferase domain-containing protein [Candidatus Woesearchaeota archaeon]